MSTHTIHLAKYCNDLEVLDILEEIGDYLDSLDPEKFKIPVSDNQAYRQFGNAVVVPVVKEIAKAMVKCMAKGKHRIMKHGDTWRVKNKWEKGHFPWIEEDSILLESLIDHVTSIDVQIIEDKHFELV